MRKHLEPQHRLAGQSGGDAARTTRPATLIIVLLLGFLGVSLQSSSGIDAIDSTQAKASSSSLLTQEFLTPVRWPAEGPASPTASPRANETPQTEAASPAPAPTRQATEAPPVAVAAPALVPPPVVAKASVPPASAPLSIDYDDAGINVAIYPLVIDQAAEQSQSIVPPFTLDGYWLTSFGSPGAGSSNTTYIVGHSWDDRDAPFNRLSSHASPGHTFEVTTGTGSMTYRVDSVTTYVKSELKSSDIWGIQPNRIVLISCYTADPFGKNVVVTASPVSR